MNLFPLCTASVWPTKSGVIVLRRDHVLNTFFSFRSLRARIFTINDSSTYGPFLTLWPISKISRVACGVTACGVARKAPAARHALCYAARRTSHALLSCPAPFTSPNNEFRGPFLFMPRLLALDLAPRVRGGPATRALALAAAERVIDGVHRHAADSGAAADLELDVVHRRPERDLEQRHRVADADVRAGTGDDAVADVQALRRQDVALLAEIGRASCR